MASDLEQAFLTYWIQLAPPKVAGLLSEPEYLPKVKDITGKVRKWRVDYAIPTYKIAIELEGGIYTRGRHTRGIGYTGDCEKYNALTVAGWRVLRFTSDWFNSKGKLSPMAMIETILLCIEV